MAKFIAMLRDALRRRTAGMDNAEFRKGYRDAHELILLGCALNRVDAILCSEDKSCDYKDGVEQACDDRWMDLVV